MNEQNATMDSEERADTGSHFPPPSAPPPGGRSVPWYRIPVSRDPVDDKVGGVVAGLSRAFGFDVRTTRIAVAIATIVMPVIALVYIVAWVLLPARPEEAVALEAIVRDRRRMPIFIAIGIVLVAGGVGSFGSWFLFGGLPWGLGLIAVGVLLWAAPGFGARRWSPPPPPPGTAETPVDTSRPTPTGTFVAAPPPQLPASPKRPPRVPVGSAAFFAALAFAGVAAAGDALDWWNISVLGVVVVALVVAITGDALSTVVNRSLAPLPMMLLLIVPTAFLLTTRPNLDGGVGERTERPATIVAVEQRHDLAIGRLTVDLTAVDLGTEPVTVDAEVGIGQLVLLVPDNATIELDAELGGGHVVVDGDEIASGVRHHVERTVEPEGTSAATIIVEGRVGVGELAIRRVAGDS